MMKRKPVQVQDYEKDEDEDEDEEKEEVQNVLLRIRLRRNRGPKVIVINPVTKSVTVTSASACHIPSLQCSLYAATQGLLKPESC
jgi:hypothetical protein